MDIATQTHLTTLRNLLTYRLQELRADVHATEQAKREPLTAGVDEAADRNDGAAQQQFSDLTDKEVRDIDEMGQVEAALHRLDLGIYGDCALCGEPISLQRLLAQPAAQRCAACQAAYEHALRLSRFRR